MGISYQEKPVQQPQSLGKDANGWPSATGTIWRVIETGNEDFEVGDLLLNLASRYKGYAIINLRTQVIHTGEIKDGYKTRIVQDFTINSVTLYADNSARP